MNVISSRWSVVSKRIFSFALCAVVFALCALAQAQEPKKVPVIGYVSGSGSPSAPEPLLDAFRQGLRKIGYTEGENILVEYRYAEGKLVRIPRLVDELVKLKVNALVLPGLPAIRAARQATTTIPIVMITPQDPVATGLVNSLARPGGNITGITTLGRELSGKRLELLKETIPGLSNVGVLWVNDANAPGLALAFSEYEAAARVVKIQLQSLEVHGPEPKLDGAFRAVTKERTNALISIRGPILNRYAKRISDLAITNRLPLMYEVGHHVEIGGLMSYTADETDSFKRAAIILDKILKGAKPAELPVEQPTKFEFVINLKAAKQIGLTIPPNVLARADKVIR